MTPKLARSPLHLLTGVSAQSKINKLIEYLIYNEMCSFSIRTTNAIRTEKRPPPPPPLPSYRMIQLCV